MINYSSIPSYPYITGDSFRHVAEYILDEYGWRNNRGIPGTIFVKTDFLNVFRTKYMPKTSFKLISHNSDYGIGVNDVYFDILSNPHLEKWYAQNVLVDHSKLVPIPIGLTNRRNPHYSDPRVITETVRMNLHRDTLVYANYNCSTNLKDRTYCRDQTKINPVTGLDFHSYLRDLCSSRFVISPVGNGIDCHRTWEALYCGASPIVTPYRLFNTMKLPILVVRDWSEYKELQLTRELHEIMWSDFDMSVIRIDGFLRYIGLCCA